jgi:hypothetical protein
MEKKSKYLQDQRNSPLAERSLLVLSRPLFSSNFRSIINVPRFIVGITKEKKAPTTSLINMADKMRGHTHTIGLSRSEPDRLAKCKDVVVADISYKWKNEEEIRTGTNGASEKR